MANVRHGPDIRPVSAASAASRRAGGDVVAEPATPPLFSSPTTEAGLPGARGCGEPWHYRNNSSADAAEQAGRQSWRYGLMEVLWRYSGLKTAPRGDGKPQFTVRRCRRVTLGSGFAEIRQRDGNPYLSGVYRCASIHGCPLCGSVIRSGRAAAISEGAGRWLQAGNSILFASFTFPHDRGMPCAAGREVVSKGWSHMTAGRAWVDLKASVPVVGYHRSVEFTYGENGWHPHIHSMIYLEGAVTAEQYAQVRLYLERSWRAWARLRGLRRPSDAHGVDVGICVSGVDVGNYIAKTQEGRAVGNELVRGDLKAARHRSRTPFQILDDFRVNGDKSQLALWLEYEQATKGLRAITSSRGLPEILGVPEQTDDELAAENRDGEAVALVPVETWNQVTARTGLTWQLLDAAGCGGLEAVNAVLAAHGLGLARTPPG